MSTITDIKRPATRTTEQGNRIEVAMIRGFLKRMLSDDGIADAVNDLLFTHVVEGRYHPSVVAESLRLHRGDPPRDDR